MAVLLYIFAHYKVLQHRNGKEIERKVQCHANQQSKKKKGCRTTPELAINRKKSKNNKNNIAGNICTPEQSRHDIVKETKPKTEQAGSLLQQSN